MQSVLNNTGFFLYGAGFGVLSFGWLERHVFPMILRLLRRNVVSARAKLKHDIKTALGNAGVGEVDGLFRNDKALGELADEALAKDRGMDWTRGDAALIVAMVFISVGALLRFW